MNMIINGCRNFHLFIEIISRNYFIVIGSANSEIRFAYTNRPVNFTLPINSARSYFKHLYV